MNGMNNKHIAVIGAGNIGKMLLEKMKALGVPANQMWVCDSDSKQALSAAARTGANIFDLNDSSCCMIDVWLLCPGPKTLLSVLRNLTSWLKSGHIVISFAAAVPIASLEAIVPDGVSMVRVMPNMPSLVGCGMNPVCFSDKVTLEARAMVMDFLKSFGKTIEVRDEQMNWCVGLSGAAMRSILPAIEGMIRAGIEAGLSETDARLIAAQVVMGTAELVKQSPMSLMEIKNLTPMETLDETVVELLYYGAVVSTKEKIDRLQEIITAK